MFLYGIPLTAGCFDCASSRMRMRSRTSLGVTWVHRYIERVPSAPSRLLMVVGATRLAKLCPEQLVVAGRWLIHLLLHRERQRRS